MHVSMSKLFQREHSSHQDIVKPLFLYPKDPQIHIIFQCLYRWILTFVCSLFSPLEILMVSSSLLTKETSASTGLFKTLMFYVTGFMLFLKTFSVEPAFLVQRGLLYFCICCRFCAGMSLQVTFG